MFNLITPTHEQEITNLINKIEKVNVSEIVDDCSKLIEHIRSDIPKKKRISYGRYSIIKKMGILIYPLLKKKHIDIPALALKIFENQNHDQFVRSLSIQLLSIYGKERGKIKKVLTIFEKAASDEQWEVRECSAGFIRKLIKKNPNQMQKWYIKMAKSTVAMQRRFASESLRPVADNNWFKEHPEFVFSILEHLYQESANYPRTSVGNNLSDWMRVDEIKTIKIVKKLVASGNKNSCWIAFRACRNLVKKKPMLVMDILKTDQYQYKDRKFQRSPT